MRKFHPCILSILFLLPFTAAAQELFPMTEPASNVPKGALGIRPFGEMYNEVDRIRNLFGLRLMYGLTARLTVEATPTVSNHHSKDLPPEFPVHNTPQIGVTLPYRFNGVSFYAKYRFLTLDNEKTHFRMAVYGAYAALQVAHDEAEPSLLDDNSGFGGGLIATYLKGRFAASVTGGAIHPFKYKGIVPDELPALPSVPATVTYSTGYEYSASFGYRLWPGTYTSYHQVNWNVYTEFLGKSYDAMQMQVGNIYYSSPQYAVSTSGNKALQGRQYVEVYPGIQAIIGSDTRIDAAVGFPLINRSWVHYYPVYTLGVQRYFNFSRRVVSRK